MLTVEIPIRDPKNPPDLKFPDKCVNCGKPKRITMPLQLNMGVVKRGRGVMMDLNIRLCEECGRKERRITRVTLLPFVIVGLLAGAAAFLPALLLSPEGRTPDTVGFPFVFAGFAGLMAGMIAGTLAEFAMKMLFTPVYGRLLFSRPLTLISFFEDSENVIGLSARRTEKKKGLRLTFENEEIGREFRELNL